MGKCAGVELLSLDLNFLDHSSKELPGSAALRFESSLHVFYAQYSGTTGKPDACRATHKPIYCTCTDICTLHLLVQTDAKMQEYAIKWKFSICQQPVQSIMRTWDGSNLKLRLKTQCNFKAPMQQASRQLFQGDLSKIISYLMLISRVNIHIIYRKGRIKKILWIKLANSNWKPLIFKFNTYRQCKRQIWHFDPQQKQKRV